MRDLRERTKRLLVVRQPLFKVLGRRGAQWLTLSIACAGILAAAEYGTAILLQHILKSLGLEVVDGGSGFSNFLGDLDLPFICGLLALVALVRATGSFVASAANTMAKDVLHNRLRHLVVYKMLLERGAYLSGADVNQHLSETIPKASAYVFNLSKFLTVAAQTVFVAGAMFWLAPKESALGIAGLSLVGVIIYRLNREVRRISMDIPPQQRALNRGIERVARNRLFIRICRTDLLEFQELSKHIRQYFSGIVRAQMLANIAAVLPQFFGVCLLAGLIVLSRMKFGTESAVLIAFLYLFTRFVQQISLVTVSLGIMAGFEPQLRTAIEIVEKTPKKDVTRAMSPIGKGPRDGAALAPSSVEVLARPPAISLSDVTFGWEPSHPVIDGLSVKVAPGAHLGIVGPSGAGKTTLLYLLLGLAKPSRGHLDIDGVDAESFCNRYSNQLAYVGPEPFLIDGTIRENLKYGHTATCSDDALWGALDKAFLRKEIEAKRGGLEFHINENGEGLSAGQKQRLAIARAFLRAPRLLVLDEASANLDANAEAMIVASLERTRGECTCVIVSHRPGLLVHCDEKISL